MNFQQNVLQIQSKILILVGKVIQQAASSVNQSAGALTLTATPSGQLVPQIQQVIQPGQNTAASQASNITGENCFYEMGMS